ncbi:hypothetical protein CNMCM5793_001890 [Aspergillus hiratsukae]|uniref:Uncharacterized protein n=1 Tax=Aspergillus hiratsukae TaxID=1194566 RepID=A0A8H6UT96_9EURO|nr:hypothetical protein CNMCM5793_001890 [Aspergillus hiratsukae]KAF7162365.1 hypothetical protein CNMCM6106_009337 [Aspergillus hiratsukae]
MKQDKNAMPYAWYWHGKPLRTGLAQGEKIRPVCTGSHILQTPDHSTTGSQSRHRRNHTPALLKRKRKRNQDIAVRKATKMKSPAISTLRGLQPSPVMTIHATFPAKSHAL